MKELWNYLRETKKPIVLYGMGNGADKIISVAEKYGIKISGVFASDGFVRQKIFHGFNVTNYETAKQKFGDMVVLLCFGSGLADVLENIKRISAEQEFYAPDVPVYGQTLFNLEFAIFNRKRLENIYNKLADDVSKKVFENAVMYKLTGKINYLFDCETPVNEAYENILKLSDSETYFDLGAYRGDTVYEFLSKVGGYDKIVAVEPDLKSYNKLCINTKDIKNITCINACISDLNGKASFDMQASRGSSIGRGIAEINSLTIDSLLKYGVPTYIKADIEGAEALALKGAEQTVKNHKPKMQIAAYHRSEDLFALPEAVLNMRADYKIYLRHFPCLPCWDMSYYFV